MSHQPPRSSRPTEEHQAQLDQAAHRAHVESRLNAIYRKLDNIDLALLIITMLLLVIAFGVWAR